MKRLSKNARSRSNPVIVPELRVIPVPLEGEVLPGTKLVPLLLAALKQQRQQLLPGDILVVKHKIVSKSENQLVALDSISLSSASRIWAKRYGIDPRVTEVALSQSRRVVRRKRGVLITETRHGLVCANSGVDVSNVNGGEHALLLPKDPDRSASRLHRQLKSFLKFSVPVIISDSFGRPWREGLTEVAIGVAGMKAMHDYRGRHDPHGYPLRVTIDAVADELACAAGLVCGKLTRTPACIIRGFNYRPGKGRARDLVRPAANDLFR
jgi:coenzyme F420-0:L-glutamate ligase/coenzyme F420-1:gamma-L-glutamate ligase